MEQNKTLWALKVEFVSQIRLKVFGNNENFESIVKANFKFTCFT